MKDDFVAKTESVLHDNVHSVQTSKGIEDEANNLCPGTTRTRISRGHAYHADHAHAHTSHAIARMQVLAQALTRTRAHAHMRTLAHSHLHTHTRVAGETRLDQREAPRPNQRKGPRPERGGRAAP
eukprot:6205850-Pleurochrysis_carterae.AAC.1